MQTAASLREAFNSAAAETAAAAANSNDVAGTYAPRRDDESEGLSKAMAWHRIRFEAWFTVLRRVNEADLQMRASDATEDMRREYASLSTDEALARAEAVMTFARKEGILDAPINDSAEPIQ